MQGCWLCTDLEEHDLGHPEDSMSVHASIRMDAFHYRALVQTDLQEHGLGHPGDPHRAAQREQRAHLCAGYTHVLWAVYMSYT